MLKLLSIAVGAAVSWSEVLLALGCAGLFYAGIVLALSI